MQPGQKERRSRVTLWVFPVSSWPDIDPIRDYCDWLDQSAPAAVPCFGLRGHVEHARDLEVRLLISRPRQALFPFGDFKRSFAKHSSWANHQWQSSHARQSRHEMVLWEP